MQLHRSVREILAKPPGTPRILVALDGGGIRGVLTLQLLRAFEALMRRRWNRPDLVLADCVDYFAGTSTGGIIAAALAMGRTVDDIDRLYGAELAQMFEQARLWRLRTGLHKRSPLAEMLKRELGEQTLLGSENVRTLLLLCMRNANTDSPWPISNNPNAMFNEPGRPDSNLRLPLWQLVRASTAAPVYFAPEEVRVGSSRFLFVDGGLTPYFNPAFQLYQMATHPAYRLGWPTGTERLLLVSFGTGLAAAIDRKSLRGTVNLLGQVRDVIPALMTSMSIQQDVLCRTIGRCRHGDPIDAELGTLTGQSDGAGFFSYLRFNVELSRQGLTQLLARLPERSALQGPLSRIADQAPSLGLQRLNALANAPRLAVIGQALAEADLRESLFEGFLPAREMA
ncbi:MAG: patatin-like phospholipase family protein [Lautropia sp.]